MYYKFWCISWSIYKVFFLFGYICFGFLLNIKFLNFKDMFVLKRLMVVLFFVGVLRILFDILYDEDIIFEDGFN